MRAIHQFVPYLNEGAIGSHLLEIQRTIRGLGRESEVFAGELPRGPLVGRAHLYTDYGTAFPGQADDVLLYHLALGSPMARWLIHQPRFLAVDYHNITPFEFFEPWHQRLTEETAQGRLEMHQLAAHTGFSMADSTYNADDLLRAGYEQPAVVPILLDLADLEAAPDPVTLARLSEVKASGGRDWLFVGRMAPNKCQHHLVAAFATYRRFYDPQARLHLVGGPSPDSYFDAVAAYARRLGVAAQVEISGSVSPAEMSAHYRAADVLVGLSEHEGFWVPPLEAWHHGLPVVAFSSTAVPETVGDGGLLLRDKSPDRVAAAVWRLLDDADLRTGLATAGRKRLETFALEHTRARFVEVLDQLDAAADAGPRR